MPTDFIIKREATIVGSAYIRSIHIVNQNTINMNVSLTCNIHGELNYSQHVIFDIDISNSGTMTFTNTEQLNYIRNSIIEHNLAQPEAINISKSGFDTPP